jgi:hypothetical protein
MDTRTRRDLASSEYNARRAQGAAAAAALGTDTLRDVAIDDVALLQDPVFRRRARHVVSENERTVVAASAMHAGDLPALGAPVEAGHTSLRDDFEVSSPQLDAMVACAAWAPGYVGARMTGAGFGGCDRGRDGRRRPGLRRRRHRVLRAADRCAAVAVRDGRGRGDRDRPVCVDRFRASRWPTRLAVEDPHRRARRGGAGSAR